MKEEVSYLDCPFLGTALKTVVLGRSCFFTKWHLGLSFGFVHLDQGNVIGASCLTFPMIPWASKIILVSKFLRENAYMEKWILRF